MQTAFAKIKEERKRQDEKWSVQDHSPSYWMVILMEEVGEACQQICGDAYDIDKFREEIVQVAAVSVAILEATDYVEAN